MARADRCVSRAHGSALLAYRPIFPRASTRGEVGQPLNRSSTLLLKWVRRCLVHPPHSQRPRARYLNFAPHPRTRQQCTAKACEGTEQSSNAADPFDSENSAIYSRPKWRKAGRKQKQTRKQSRRAKTRPRHLPRLPKNQSQSILRSPWWCPAQAHHPQKSSLHPNRRRSPPMEKVTRTSQVCQCAYLHHVNLVK